MDKNKYIKELITRYPILEPAEPHILTAYELLKDSYAHGGKLLVAGNGGSCADSEHIVGELMKGFLKRRPVTDGFKERLLAADTGRGGYLAQNLQQALPAISLTCHTGLSTAFSNDVGSELVYAQQIYGYGRKGDVFLGITTSGNAENIMYGAVAAKAADIKIIGLTGNDGGLLAKISDVSIIVPEQSTYKIQELHLPIYHTLCLMLEDHFFLL